MIRAPQDAIAWVPTDGWLFDPVEARRYLDAGGLVLVVSDDGYVHGVQPTDRAPLAAVLRLDASVDDLVLRLDELGDRLAGIDVSAATDVRECKALLTALSHRVHRLEQQQ